jgi:AraC-like DNA-binding protein
MKAHLEALLRPADRLLNSKLVRLPAFDHPYHFHPEVEITFIAESGGTCVVGDHIGSFQAGDLYLLGANLPHVFRNTGTSAHGAAAEVLHFAFDPERGVFGRIPELAEFQRLIERGGRGLLFDAETSRTAAGLLQRIRKAGGARRMAAFCELAAILLEAPEPRTLASGGFTPGAMQLAGSERIRRVCNVILEKFPEDLSHLEMARLAHMAPAAFSRLFRKTTRKTFTRFVTEVRLGHACRLLCESDKTVAEIAFQSGFNSLANFNRRFRHHHGCGPREYRNAFGTATSPPEGRAIRARR